MNTRDNQVIFNHFCTTFFKNETPRCVCVKDGKYVCQYAPSTPEQVGCAVGCLLDVEDAKRADDELLVYGSTVQDLMEFIPDIYNKYFDLNQVGFLEALQEIHDGYLPGAGGIKYMDSANQKKKLAYELVQLADKFDLSVYKYVIKESEKELSNV